MQIKTKAIKQYNSTYKHLLIVNGEPICLADGGARLSEFIKYLEGYEADINDGAIKKALDKCIEKCKFVKA